MGLFGFGKGKKKEEKEKIDIKKRVLSFRRYDRYHVENLYIPGIGEVIDISKKGAAIKKSEVAEIKRENIDLELENVELKAHVKRETLKEVGVNFDEELDIEEIIKKHLKRPVIYDFPENREVYELKHEEGETLEKVKAVINLMLELDDPNTSVEKFKNHIEALPVLRERILKKANSVESASKSEIKSVTTAITRIGFEEIKKIVYDYINEQISLTNDNFENFENYEFYNILKSSFFKKMAPLFAFRDLRSEGRSLLTTDTIGMELFLNTAPVGFKNLYRSPLQLYSAITRLYEERVFGVNFIEVNRDYYVNRMGVFKYLFDGYVLAHLNHNPFLELSKDFRITLSSRKLRFAYVAYLTFLALEFVLSKDKRSGTVLLNRLKRFGLDGSKAIGFVQETISEANEILEKLEVSKKIQVPAYPNIALGLEKSFGKELHISALIEKLRFVSENDVKRVAFRFEDSWFASYVLSVILNSFEFDFADMPFCVIPCANIEDEDLKMDMFDGFDIVIFKDIERLKEDLFDDFLKLWNDFEGKIFVTYCAYSLIDFSKPALHNVLKDFIIEMPSYYDNDYIYKGMLKNACSECNAVLNENICDVSSFMGEIYTMDSVWRKCVDKFAKG